jgi:hypothetical protein
LVASGECEQLLWLIDYGWLEFWVSWQVDGCVSGFRYLQQETLLSIASHQSSSILGCLKWLPIAGTVSLLLVMDERLFQTWILIASWQACLEWR